MQELAKQPDTLVEAARQVVALGARPPAEWVATFTSLTQGLMGHLSPQGLARAAEALALLQAGPPPAVWLDVLLGQVRCGWLVGQRRRRLHLA